jgi:lipopolysaccharide biosynthesis glycosyltransferase
MMETAKKHVPDVPVCLCAVSKIGPEDILVKQPDSDIGGRRAKLKAYELTPPEWKSVLYLDVDTEIISPDVMFLLQLIEDGWEFVICKDPHLMDTMHSFRRPNNIAELMEIEHDIFTLHTLQINGGVWAFGRNKRIEAFFKRWQREYEKHLQRDQGALVRALYAAPLKIYYLGNQWNYFDKYSKGIKPAAIKHYPGRARRWSGIIPGRIDSATAWRAVKRHEAERRR